MFIVTNINTIILIVLMYLDKIYSNSKMLNAKNKLRERDTHTRTHGTNTRRPSIGRGDLRSVVTGGSYMQLI